MTVSWKKAQKTQSCSSKLSKPLSPGRVWHRKQYLGTSNLNVSMLDWLLIFFLSSITNFLLMVMSLMLLCVFSLWFCLVVKLYFLISTHSENLIHLGLTAQKFKNLVLCLRGSPFWFPKFCQILSLLYWPTLKISCVHHQWLKKFEFWQPCFWSKLPSLVPPNFSQILSFLCLLTSNTSCFQLKRLKTFNFRRPCLRGTPHFWIPFVRFSLFLLSIHSKNSIRLPLMV